MKKATHIPSSVIAILLGMASTLAQGASPSQPIQDIERAALFPSATTISQGRDVAETICASCHGMNGISNDEGMPHLAGQRAVYLYRAQWAYNDGGRFDATKKHNGFLNDQARLAVSAYYASLESPQRKAILAADEQVETPTEDPFLTIRESMKKCVKCHDETGNSEGSGMPNLTAQNPEYFVDAMTGYIDGSRSHKLMARLAKKLDKKTIKDMGVFYAVQEPVITTTQGEGDVNVGQRLSETCAACHGDDGNAHKPTMPTLAGQDARYFIKAMKQYKDGMRKHEKMFDAVEVLSEQDMIDLATYYAAQEPRRRDVRTPLVSTQWIARCERCHGINGNSSDPRFPMLAGQDATYLKNVLKAYASGERVNGAMHIMSGTLTSMDIERLAAFFAAQQARPVVYIQLPFGNDDLQ